jgi:hypothetical protein
MSELQKILLGALISVVISASTGYYAGKEQAAIQIAQLAERQANQYNELRGMIRDSKDANDRNFLMIREDFNGVRGEIMSIIKGRR